MAEVLSEKEVQQLLNSVETLKGKNQTRKEKIEALNLPTEEKLRLDAVVKGIDEFAEGLAEQMAQGFLGIKEGFAFNEERVKIIKREVIGGFAEAQLNKLEFSLEQKAEILKIIMGEEEAKEAEAKEIAAKSEKAPKQELLEKAYEQIMKQKDIFIQILGSFKFEERQVDNLLFFKQRVREVETVLKIDLTTGSVALTMIGVLEKILRTRDNLVAILKNIDDENFISSFERFERAANEIKEIATQFFSNLENKINWLTEFNLLFSLIDDKLELAGQVSEKLEPLLKHFEFEQIYPKKGEEYDPRKHKVEGEEPSVFKRGQIARVARRGIKKGGEVLIKARVVIAK